MKTVPHTLLVSIRLMATALVLMLPGVTLHAEKHRVIVATDIGGDPDDMNSVIRYLTYANEFDTEGIVITPMWNKLPKNPDADKRLATSLKLVMDRIDAYEQVLPKLRQHAEGYPSADALRALTKTHTVLLTKDAKYWDWVGEGKNRWGHPKDSEGSDLIVRAMEKDDPRPIFCQAWGGTLPIAQAIHRYEKRNPGKKASERLIIQDSVGQDMTKNYFFNYWGKDQPDYEGPKDRGYFYLFMKSQWGELVLSNRDKDPRWHDHNWINPNIRNNHGPLGAMYWGGYMHEGDSWAILYLLSHANGLTDPKQPSQGGWGARFHRAPKWGGDHIYLDDGRWKREDDVSTIRFYRQDIENDFAARMDWQVKDVNQANHNPVAALNGDKSRNVIYQRATPGATVQLDAAGSSDPDGDSLSYGKGVRTLFEAHGRTKRCRPTAGACRLSQGHCSCSPRRC